jgi:hypothetical protein
LAEIRTAGEEASPLRDGGFGEDLLGRAENNFHAAVRHVATRADYCRLQARQTTADHRAEQGPCRIGKLGHGFKPSNGSRGLSPSACSPAGWVWARTRTALSLSRSSPPPHNQPWRHGGMTNTKLTVDPRDALAAGKADSQTGRRAMLKSMDGPRPGFLGIRDHDALHPPAALFMLSPSTNHRARRFSSLILPISFVLIPGSSQPPSSSSRPQQQHTL